MFGPPEWRSAITVTESLRPAGQDGSDGAYRVTMRPCGSMAAAYAALAATDRPASAAAPATTRRRVTRILRATDAPLPFLADASAVMAGS
jgi:hypothetical protein